MLLSAAPIPQPSLNHGLLQEEMWIMFRDIGVWVVLMHE